MPFDGIGDLLLEPPQINVVHLHGHVQRPRSYRQRTVQIHIDERRIDMEVVHRQHAVLQRVVAFHPGQEIAPVTAPMGADIPHHRGIVQRARHRDDVVDIAGNRLVRRHERREILQHGLHGRGTGREALERFPGHEAAPLPLLADALVQVVDGGEFLHEQKPAVRLSLKQDPHDVGHIGKAAELQDGGMTVLPGLQRADQRR